MKKLISLALISGVLALPTAASAAGDPTCGPYKNRGQCESALATELALERKADHQAGGSPSDDNAFVHEHVNCGQDATGAWIWVFT